MKFIEDGIIKDKDQQYQMELDAQEEYQYWYKTDKTNFKKINKLIKDIKRSPFNGLGKAND